MLRYYDEMGLLKPDRIDTFTGYRLYSAAQFRFITTKSLKKKMSMLNCVCK
ncbi:hypothetical protein Q1X24_13675 [Enterococcus sp. B1E4]|nr:MULTISPECIES: MerR family transcriptional regulator [unclassified Enterococcus]MDO0895903.1 hypothetical protein [Enterococcus sp. B1E4]MDO0908691.1 hypothetical protein [Enterococcus sp. B2E4]